MIFFTEWKDGEDGVLGIVADFPTQPGASKTHGYMMLFEALPNQWEGA